MLYENAKEADIRCAQAGVSSTALEDFLDAFSGYVEDAPAPATNVVQMADFVQYANRVMR